MMSLKMALERRKARGTLKTIMVGENDVGKQSLLCRIIRGDQDLEKVVGIQTVQCQLNESLVTSIYPNSSNDSPLDLLYSGAQLILVVFDISRKKTLDDAIEQLQESANKKNAGPEAQLLLIAHRIGNGPREVTPEEGEKVALKYDMMYMEVDAEKTTQKELLSKLTELGEKFRFLVSQTS